MTFASPLSVTCHFFESFKQFCLSITPLVCHSFRLAFIVNFRAWKFARCVGQYAVLTYCLSTLRCPCLLPSISWFVTIHHLLIVFGHILICWYNQIQFVSPQTFKCNWFEKKFTWDLYILQRKQRTCSLRIISIFKGVGFVIRWLSVCWFPFFIDIWFAPIHVFFSFC